MLICLRPSLIGHNSQVNSENNVTAQPAQRPGLGLVNPDPNRAVDHAARFDALASDGADIHAEARLIDTLVPRHSWILDAGCGFGRVAGRLEELGHRCIGVDRDQKMIEEATRRFPNLTTITADLADPHFAAKVADRLPEERTTVDCVAAVGNVMVFIPEEHRRDVLNNLAAILSPTGRLVVGFADNRGYDFGHFIVDAESVGLRLQLAMESWDLRPFDEDSDFLVTVFGTR